MTGTELPPSSRGHLFVVGAPKAGTTTLYDHLRTHPQIRMSRPKEPHFFDVHFEEGLERYWSNHFGDTPLETNLLAGEATPHYLFVPYVSRRIARFAPDAKLVALLRDPVERAYSDWWMYWTRGTEPLTFEAAIDANLERLRTGPYFRGDGAEELWRDYYRRTASGAPGEIQFRPYVEIGHYAEQLDRYFEDFPADQIRVFMFEELRDRPERVLSSLRDFLGLEQRGSSEPGHRANVALGGFVRPVYRAARAVGMEALLHRLPRRMKRWIKRTSAVVSPRPSMPSEVRRRLAEHYAPRIRRLESLLGRDLSHWSRP